jgi:hypothetical protein
VEEGCPENIHSFRNFRIPVPDQLSTEKSSSTFISTDSKNDFLGARIMSFAIQKGGLIRTRIRPRISRLFFLKTRAHDQKFNSGQAEQQSDKKGQLQPSLSKKASPSAKYFWSARTGGIVRARETKLAVALVTWDCPVIKGSHASVPREFTWVICAGLQIAASG